MNGQNPAVKLIGAAGDSQDTATATVSNTTSFPDSGFYRFRRQDGVWYFRPSLSESQTFFDVWVLEGLG